MYALRQLEPMPTLAPDDRIQSWRIEAEIGRGAMARVYRVRHDELGTVAALKVLDRVDDDTERRLLVEGRVQAAAGHPGIVAVRDVMRLDDGRAALLMDLVDGTDLQSLLVDGPMALDEALPLFREILEAMEAAHQRGWIHRDLKPGNVLVAREGVPRARVGDFGMVKELDSSATATRALLGSPRYMAPEQMRSSRRADARSDVFALGCILYEMVTGRQPFPGDDLVDLFTAKSGGAYADPSVLHPGLPSAVRTAIHGALTGAAHRRIPSCAVFGAVLDGAAWPPASQLDDTLEDTALTVWRCPRCGASVESDPCDSCSADTMLAGRYQLVDALAQHPPTVVFRALDLQEGRWVVARGLADSATEEVRGRFERGLQVLGELDHAQLPVQLAEGFEEHGRLWEIRELIDGDTLAEELTQGRFSEREVLETLLDLVPVLAYLHERQPPVVHRALMPEHVMRAEDGRLVLLDFAHVYARVPDAELGAQSFEGAFGGMAPEQYAGDASPASDVYGLATFAVSLLSRRQLASLQTTKGLAWREAVQVSGACEALLDAMLHDDPAVRPDVRTVGRRIASILADEPVVALAPVEQQPGFVQARRRAVGLTLAAAVGVLGVAAAGWGAVDRLQHSWSARAVLATYAEPAELRPAATGMDGREVPMPACDSEPFVARLRVIGDTPADAVPVHWQADCTRGFSEVAELPVDTWVDVPLDAGGRIGLGTWSGYDCLDASGESTYCVVRPGSETLTLMAEPRAGFLARVVDATGRPGDARVRYADRHPGVPTDPRGEAWVADVPAAGGFRRSLWHVDLDGVAVPTVEDLGDDAVVLTVMDELAIHRGRIVDGAGQPAAGADVTCATFDSRHGSGREALSANAGERSWVTTTTDADGAYACAFPVRSGSLYVRLVEAEGRQTVDDAVDTVHDLPSSDVLLPTRDVWVGCAGLPDGQCSMLARCRAADRRGRASSCHEVRGFDGSLGMRCQCEDSEVAIEVGDVASRLPTGDQLWLDLRDVRGGFRGRVPAGVGDRRRCFARAADTDHDFVRGTRVDEDGAFVFDGLEPGLWWSVVRCQDHVWRQEVEVGNDLLSLDLRLEDAQPPE